MKINFGSLLGGDFLKQKISNAEKLYHLLFEIYTSKENKHHYVNGAYEVVLSVTLIMKDNTYKSVTDVLNPDNIKTFFVLNQMTGKKLVFLAKDIKSSSYQHGELRINRYKTVIDEVENQKYRRQKMAQLLFEKEIEMAAEDEEEED